MCDSAFAGRMHWYVLILGLINNKLIGMQTTSFNSGDPKNKIKFPRIETHKARSLPGEKRFSSLLDEVSARAWIYCTPSSEYGTLYIIVRLQD